MSQLYYLVDFIISYGLLAVHRMSNYGLLNIGLGTATPPGKLPLMLTMTLVGEGFISFGIIQLRHLDSEISFFR